MILVFRQTSQLHINLTVEEVDREIEEAELTRRGDDGEKERVGAEVGEVVRGEAEVGVVDGDQERGHLLNLSKNDPTIKSGHLLYIYIPTYSRTSLYQDTFINRTLSFVLQTPDLCT